MPGFWRVILQLLRYGQKYIIYPAGFEEKPRKVATPDSRPLINKHEIPKIETRDGIALDCYYIRQEWYGKKTNQKKKTRAIVIMFHGNALNHGDILPLAEEFLKLQCDVLTVDYRGYGHSGGKPSERGLQRDAEAVIQHVKTNYAEKDKIPVIVYGQSLGGAVAIYITSLHPKDVHALIIENAFTSLPDVVGDIPSLRRLKTFVSEKWLSSTNIRQTGNIPILILTGKLDEVIPTNHSQKLKEIALKRSGPGSSNVNFHEFPHGHHSDTCLQSGYWKHVATFLEKHLAKSDIGSSSGKAPGKKEKI